MHATIEDWGNGWKEIEVSLTLDDIDRLIALLNILKADTEQHFHASSSFIGEGGIGQMTFDVQQKIQSSNLTLGGRALAPGESTQS